MGKKKIQKPFDIKAAQAGATVETREGNSVRILCYDKNDRYPIVALVAYGDCEAVRTYPLNGKYNDVPNYFEDLVIVEEVEESERWADEKYAEGDGYSITTDGNIKRWNNQRLNHPTNKNLFATEKQAKAARAMARISQIMANDERFGGVVTDEEWNDDRLPKYCIYRLKQRICTGTVCCEYYFLAFHDFVLRDLFLEENKQLVKDFLMID